MMAPVKSTFLTMRRTTRPDKNYIGTEPDTSSCVDASARKEGETMNDNAAVTGADRYQALADDAYAASDRLTGESQLIMRQIALSYHRLALIEDALEQEKRATVGSALRPESAAREA
jgi:hypothetical protein